MWNTRRSVSGCYHSARSRRVPDGPGQAACFFLRRASGGRISDFLFAYGTLRPSSGHPIGDLLGDHAERIGPATLRGALFDLGAYPGAVELDGAQSVVHGEVVRLRDPTVLRHLDDYEGRDYRRVTREVHLWDGSPVEAWVYLYEGPLEGARTVRSGNWLED